MIKLKNAVIWFKNIFRDTRGKLPYLTKYGKPIIAFPVSRYSRRMTDDVILHISDDRIRELTDDCHNVEMGRYE